MAAALRFAGANAVTSSTNGARAVGLSQLTQNLATIHFVAGTGAVVFNNYNAAQTESEILGATIRIIPTLNALALLGLAGLAAVRRR
jgi:hypothetical protein